MFRHDRPYSVGALRGGQRLISLIAGAFLVVFFLVTVITASALAWCLLKTLEYFILLCAWSGRMLGGILRRRFGKLPRRRHLWWTSTD